MASKPYMAFYVGDYIKDTRMLTLEEKGAWTEILFQMHALDLNGELSTTWGDLALMVGCRSESKIKQIVSKIKAKKVCDFVITTPNENDLENEAITLINRRMRKDKPISKIRSEAGKKGGRPKKAKKANAKQNADIDNDIEYDNDIKNNSLERGVGKTFLKFWQMYDKNAGEEETRNAWNEIPAEIQEIIFSRLPGYIKSTPVKKYRLDPVNYLTREKWKDEIPEDNPKGKHPDHYDPNYEKTLQGNDLMEYYQHLKSLGWVHTKSPQGFSSWHLPKLKAV